MPKIFLHPGGTAENLVERRTCIPCTWFTAAYFSILADAFTPQENSW